MTNNMRVTSLMISRLELVRKIVLRKALKGEGLHYKQRPILEYIINNDGCTQSELAEALRVTPASIATSTKRMQNAGLVTKHTDKNDLRCNRLCATQKGREIATRCREKYWLVTDTLFEGFTADEVSQLQSMLCRLIKNISGDDMNKMEFRDLVALNDQIDSEEY